MFRAANYRALVWVLAFFAMILYGQTATAADKYAGWELDSEYNSLYDVADLEEFKAVFLEEIEVVPLKGMDPGVGIMIYDKNDPDKEVIEVHLGPKGAFNLGSLKLRKGDEIKVRGVFADLDEKEIFMASKVKKKPSGEVKVRRTSDGKPIWTMTAQELAEMTE